MREGETHVGWVKKESRVELEALMKEGKTIWVKVIRKQRKWTQFDPLIGRNRDYRTGYAEWFAM